MTVRPTSGTNSADACSGWAAGLALSPRGADGTCGTFPNVQRTVSRHFPLCHAGHVSIRSERSVCVCVCVCVCVRVRVVADRVRSRSPSSHLFAPSYGRRRHPAGVVIFITECTHCVCSAHSAGRIAAAVADPEVTSRGGGRAGSTSIYAESWRYAPEAEIL